MAVKVVKSENKNFIIILLLTERSIITCDTCGTLKWRAVVAVFHYVVANEAPGALFVMLKTPSHCYAK